MEKQSNSDLNAANQTETSTSLVGQLLSQETPNLNKVYEDDVAVVADHFYDGKHVLHSDFKVEPTLSVLKHCQEVSHLIDLAYAERGIDRLYTWGNSEEHDRYNRLLGFVPTGMQYDFGEPVGIYLEYAKDLI